MLQSTTCASGRILAADSSQLCLLALYCLLQKYPIIDVRGRGLMLAAEFGGADGSLAARPHTAADLTHAAAQRGMLLMGAGEDCL